jgi:hypothetical protein
MFVVSIKVRIFDMYLFAPNEDILSRISCNNMPS